MANTRQLATIDEEALVPKRVKKKKPKKTIAKKSIQIIAQEMQQMRARLNALKQTLGENDALSGILHTHFADKLLPFLNTPSLFAYSATSKQAYINAHEHRISKFRLFSAPARLHLDRAQTLSNQIDKKANLGIEMTSVNTNKASSLALGIGCLLFATPATLGGWLAWTLGENPGNQNNNEPTTTDSATTADILTLTMVGVIIASALLGISLVYITIYKVYPALKNHFDGIKENNKENLNLLNQFSELLEKNDLETLQEKLQEYSQNDHSSKIKAELKLFPPAEGTRNDVADEETPLLRR